MIPKWELFLYLIMTGLLAFTGVTASMVSENSLNVETAALSPILSPGRADLCPSTDYGTNASHVVPANEACEIQNPDSSLFSFQELP